MKYLFKILFLMVACLTTNINSLYAQDQKAWKWVSHLGGRSWDMCTGLASDKKDNLYVAGNYFDTLHCDKENIQSSGDQDIFIARFDLKGNIKKLWSIGGKGHDQVNCLSISGNNSIVIGGIISNEVKFDNITSKDFAERLFVANLNEKGSIRCISTFTSSGQASLLFINTDEIGKIYVTGSFTGTLKSGNYSVTSLGKKDIFIARINPSGSIEKMISFGGEEDDLPTGFASSRSNNVVVAGVAGKKFSIDNFKIEVDRKISKLTGFILQFDRDFKAISNSPLAFEGFGHISALKYDQNGNYYATGSFNHRLRCLDTIFVSQGYTDGFLLKYKSDGNLCWGREFGTWYYDHAVDLVLDNLEGAIITGSMGDTLSVDGIMLKPLMGNNSSMILQFSLDGQAVWGDCVSGIGGSFCNGTTIDRKGNLYLSGAFGGTFHKGLEDLTSKGDQDVFLARYGNCPDAEGEISGNSTICSGEYRLLSIKNKFKHIIWNDTIYNQNIFMAEKPGKYWVTMMNKQGCTLSDTVEVEQSSQTTFSLGKDLYLPTGSEFELWAPRKFTDYRWQDNSTNQSIVINSENGIPGTKDYWVTALDSSGCEVCDTVKVEFYTTQGWIDPLNIELITYPNPVKNSLFWSVSTNRACQMLLELTDETGRVIYSQHIKQYSPGSTMSIDFSDFSPGNYYLQIKDKQGIESKSVCLVRQ